MRKRHLQVLVTRLQADKDRLQAERDELLARLHEKADAHACGLAGVRGDLSTARDEIAGLADSVRAAIAPKPAGPEPEQPNAGESGTTASVLKVARRRTAS
jgi:hypothetical protein